MQIKTNVRAGSQNRSGSTSTTTTDTSTTSTSTDTSGKTSNATFSYVSPTSRCVGI